MVQAIKVAQTLVVAEKSLCHSLRKLLMSAWHSHSWLCSRGRSGFFQQRLKSSHRRSRLRRLKPAPRRFLVGDVVGRTPRSAPDALVRLAGTTKRPTSGSAADEGVRPTDSSSSFACRRPVAAGLREAELCQRGLLEKRDPTPLPAAPAAVVAVAGCCSPCRSPAASRDSAPPYPRSGRNRPADTCERNPPVSRRNSRSPACSCAAVPAARSCRSVCWP